MPFSDHCPSEPPAFEIYRVEAKRLRTEARSAALRRIWLWLETSAAGLRTVERRPIARPRPVAYRAALSGGVRG